MIDLAVAQIAKELNQHLTKLFYLDDDIVVISNIGEQHGTVISDKQNKLVISLVNIAEDTTPTRASQSRQAQAYKSVDHTPPMCLNLHILISANFNLESYEEGLKFISYTIGYFQKNNVFTSDNCPPLKGEIDQIIMEIQNLDFQEWNNLWGMMDRRCLPSVMYKARMLAYDDTHTDEYLSL